MPERSGQVSRRRGQQPRVRAALVLVLVCVAALQLIVAARPSAASPPATVSLPNTPAGRQASWLFGAVTHGPIPTTELAAHFDSAFLAQVSPAHLNETFVAVKSLQVDSVTASTPDSVDVIVTVNGKTRFSVALTVDAHDLISNLMFFPLGVATPVAPPPATPSTWAAVEADFRSVAPEVRFLVASVNGGSCQTTQALDPNTAAPLASSFKLYVLDALARAVESGKVSWDEELTITSAVKSIPSGILQDEPDGTRVSVQQAATDMISISDNTAADMLISLLGRGAVEAATKAAGMADPGRNVPFLTTRERFVLEAYDWPQLAQRYLSLDPAGRLKLLTETVDRVPLASIKTASWTVPRNIDSIEWFASPADMCRVYASLATLALEPKLAPLAGILKLPTLAGLNRVQWRSAWFKGGSEPGVLTFNMLATTQSGKTYVVRVLAENPTGPIPVSADSTLGRAATGAFELAAR